MGLISLANLHLSLSKEKKKKIISHPLKKINLFHSQPDICLFFLPLSSHPFMPALTFHFSPASNPPPFFCSFLLVIHLWQPTPPSHTSSLPFVTLSHSPDTHPRHRLLILYVYLLVSVRPTRAHTPCVLSPDTPPLAFSCATRILSSHIVGGIECLFFSTECIIS